MISGLDICKDGSAWSRRPQLREKRGTPGENWEKKRFETLVRKNGSKRERARLEPARGTHKDGGGCRGADSGSS